MYGIELQMVAQVIQADRTRKAQENRFVRKVLRKSQKQSAFRVDTLTYLTHKLTSWVQGMAPEPAN
jgi:hypothetical protein